MPKRSNPRAEHLRRALAQEAARIMAEQGVDDYLLAKRKAAERLGATDIAVLPRNVEIEEALAEHHRLFGAQTHSRTLRASRRAAEQAMQLLERFQPRLVGGVLSGTASAHSDIHLHVFADNAESVALALVDRGIPHEIVERRVRYEPDRLVSYPAVRFQAGAHSIDAIIFPLDGIRQAPSSPVDGKPMRRAAIGEVRALIAQSQPDR
jgi:predicted nucleotidyltransferase